jgi:hypothetical protein
VLKYRCDRRGNSRWARANLKAIRLRHGYGGFCLPVSLDDARDEFGRPLPDQERNSDTMLSGNFLPSICAGHSVLCPYDGNSNLPA